MASDNVNHPDHYASDEIECIDAIHAQLGDDGFMAYCQGNVAKYLWRWRRKNGLEDLRKAQVYLGWMVEEAELDELVEKDDMEREERMSKLDALASDMVAFSEEHGFYEYADCTEGGEADFGRLLESISTPEGARDAISYLEDFAVSNGEAAPGARGLIARLEEVE